MPLSVHYTPKVWIIRHKILCLGSIKMCVVITKHILVRQLGNEGKKKGRKHRVLLYPLLVLMSFPTYAIEVPTCYWTWMGHYLFACIECFSKPSMFQLSTTLFLEYVHVFLTCVHVCLRLFFFWKC